MEITFLGTGASLGVPMIGCTCDVCRSDDPRDKRLRTSLLIRANGETVIIDAGPDFRRQCLAYDIRRIDAFLFTHPHFDHIGGMDETRAVYYAMDKTPLQFYAEPFTFDGIRKHFDYLFPEKGKSAYHGAPDFRFHEIQAGKSFSTGRNSFLPLRAFHGKMPVTGYKTGNLVYLTDVKTVPPETAKEIDGNTTLILNALHRKPHPLHFNLDEALHFIAAVRPARAYLIHISHWMGTYKEVARQLPDNVSLAYDGLKIRL